jgi:hypothetical protein
MNRESLGKRRDRTHAIVEGALLGDIAIVFLLMRAFLPIPGARQLLRAIATIPFVVLAQRRGVGLAVLAAVASYILFSALVGPILGLAAVDVAVAGILIGFGRRLGLGPVVNTLFTGPVYALLDLLIPTVISVVIFRYPVGKLIQAARNFIRAAFNLLIFLANGVNVPHSSISAIDDWKAWAVLHWQVAWFASLAVVGILTTYLAVLVAEIVLRQIPVPALEVRRPA